VKGPGVPDEPLSSSAEQIALYKNAYQTVDEWTTSTGFRPHSLRFGNIGVTAARTIGEQFLVATRYRRADRETEQSIQSYFLDPGVVMLSRNGEEDLSGRLATALQQGAPLRRELGEVLSSRRSVRQYTGDHVALDQMATLLRAGAAITATGQVDLMEGGQRHISFHTAPSPGGLYPIDLYLLPLRIDGLDQGVWRYVPRYETLVADGDARQAAAAVESFAVPEEIITISQAAAILLLIARPWKVMRKYGDRGIRYLFIEAGAISENVHLACGALGLGSVDCASVHDDELHAALNFDGEMQLVVHTLFVGVPA